MKLKRFKLDLLYGIYNYDVPFNSDVTFLHGINGCGKTTVLDFITRMITGQLFRLFNYNFQSASLDYVKGRKKRKITVTKVDETQLKVIFNEKDHKLVKLRSEDNSSRYEEHQSESHYFEIYPWLKEVKESFNFVFLPLSRSYNLIPNMYGPLKRVNHGGVGGFAERSLVIVKQMISNNILNTMSTINAINEKFRSEMFETAFHAINPSMNKVADTNISQTKEKLKKTFRELNILSKVFETEIDNFYDKFKKSRAALQKYSQDKNSSTDYMVSAMWEYIIHFSRNLQALELCELADKMNLEKQKAMLPITQFVNRINDFFKESNKRIEMDYTTGSVKFAVNNCPDLLDIDRLSSGEKQLLIFFAYLTFGLKEGQEGIFIVDEPELSLHLSWQHNFVNNILDINNKVQLIFATHSPEIVGKYRKNVFELIPKIVACPAKEGK